jgi:hypothetical protein
MEAHTVVRCPGFHIYCTIGSKMGVGLSAIRTGRALPQRRIPTTHLSYRLSQGQGHSMEGRITWPERAFAPKSQIRFRYALPIWDVVPTMGRDERPINVKNSHVSRRFTFVLSTCGHVLTSQCLCRLILRSAWHKCVKLTRMAHGYAVGVYGASVAASGALSLSSIVKDLINPFNSLTHIRTAGNECLNLHRVDKLCLGHRIALLNLHIRIQFVPHRTHVSFPLERPSG